jgi:hypothetical protein
MAFLVGEVVVVGHAPAMPGFAFVVLENRYE